jgi:hypothetical protein
MKSWKVWMTIYLNWTPDYFSLSVCYLTTVSGYIASVKWLLINVEQMVDWKLSGEVEVLGQNPPVARRPSLSSV